jgi:hypothetical protein
VSPLYLFSRILLWLFRFLVFVAHCLVRWRRDSAEARYDTLSTSADQLSADMLRRANEGPVENKAVSHLVALSCRDQVRLARAQEDCDRTERRWERWKSRDETLQKFRTWLKPDGAVWMPWLAGTLDVVAVWVLQTHYGFDPVGSVVSAVSLAIECVQATYGG